MISDAMAKELTKQVQEELYSAYVYMAMSSYATSIGMEGTAAWFGAQVKEELGHVMKFYGYFNAQQRHCEFQAIAKPPATYKSVKAVFEAALKHEQYITGRINLLVNLAEKEKDHATRSFLQWFVTEQVEEEDSVQRVLAKLNMAGDHPGGLYIIDREIGARAAK